MKTITKDQLIETIQSAAAETMPNLYTDFQKNLKIMNESKEMSNLPEQAQIQLATMVTVRDNILDTMIIALSEILIEE